MISNSSVFWSTFYQSSIGQVLTDMNKQNIAVNQTYCDFLGYSKEEIIQNRSSVFFVHEDFIKEKHYLDQLFNDKIDKYQIEKRFTHKDGSIVWGLVSVSLIYDQQENERYIFAQVQDITEEKQTREYLQKSEKVSLAAQLAAAVAHEIRNPLTAIKGFTQLQQKHRKYNDDYITIMLGELQKIEDIISEYLSIGNSMTEKLNEENVVEIMEQVINLLQAQANMANQEIMLLYPEQLPTIKCNAMALKQSFLNIIKNSLEAMDEGESVQVIIKEADKKHILIKIIDTGCGISQERLANLGEPFYSTKERGTGLGLMTSFKIIEKHHGTIQFESVVDVGTTVTIRLPTIQSNTSPKEANEQI